MTTANCMKSAAAAFFLALLLAVAVCVCPAFADDAPDPFASGAETSLPDGEYSAPVELTGGSGRASITAPSLVTVKDGHAAVTIVWSSENYDYMKVNDVKYLPLTTKGGSTFQIPVIAFDEAFNVIGDTTAMSTPHEVEYQLTVPLASMTAGAPAASEASGQSASASASSASSSSSAASSSGSSGSTSALADSGLMTIVPIVVVIAVVVGIVAGAIHYRKGRDQ